jgi:hypothetical protein
LNVSFVLAYPRIFIEWLLEIGMQMVRVFHEMSVNTLLHSNTVSASGSLQFLFIMTVFSDYFVQYFYEDESSFDSDVDMTSLESYKIMFLTQDGNQNLHTQYVVGHT